MKTKQEFFLIVNKIRVLKSLENVEGDLQTTECMEEFQYRDEIYVI